MHLHPQRPPRIHPGVFLPAFRPRQSLLLRAFRPDNRRRHVPNEQLRAVFAPSDQYRTRRRTVSVNPAPFHPASSAASTASELPPSSAAAARAECWRRAEGAVTYQPGAERSGAPGTVNASVRADCAPRARGRGGRPRVQWQICGQCSAFPTGSGLAIDNLTIGLDCRQPFQGGARAPVLVRVILAEVRYGHDGAVNSGFCISVPHVNNTTPGSGYVNPSRPGHFRDRSRGQVGSVPQSSGTHRLELSDRASRTP